VRPRQILAVCRRETLFRPELKDLFVQVLLLAHVAGALKLGNISLDGTKIHADASKSKAVSYQHLLTLEAHLRAEVEELFALSERLDQGEMPDGLVVSDEIAIRKARLARLAEAKAVLEARAEYDAKLQERAEKARQTGRTPRGRAPKPPDPGPRDKNQYNFTDPESRIMKHRSTERFKQDYNAQIAVDQDSLLIVGESLSNHPTDQHEAEPTLDAIPSELGASDAAAQDTGYFSQANIAVFERRAIDPYIATGRDPHHPSWWERFDRLPAPLPADAKSKRARLVRHARGVLAALAQDRRVRFRILRLPAQRLAPEASQYGDSDDADQE
jgi:hypothetical protein